MATNIGTTSPAATGGDQARTRPRLRTAPDVPSEVWRMLARGGGETRKPLRGLDAAWNAAGGRARSLAPATRGVLAEAQEVLTLEPRFAEARDAELRAEAARLRALFALGRDERRDLIESFALIREASMRTLGFRPHPEQVAAGLAMHDGAIAEMATGEGKTLAATLPAIVAAWRGRGCHLITFNDYLAARDAAEMTPLYRKCGLDVAHIEQAMESDDRRLAYAADITYCTSQDVAADFLRDRLALGRNPRLASTVLSALVDGNRAASSQLVMRGLHTAIVDEADSVLIDEAVTPLIISGDAPNAQQVEAYETAARVAADLHAGADFELDRRYHEVRLTRAGRGRLERLAPMLGGVWTGTRRREEFVVQAITARELFLRDQQYVIEDGEVVIVDESTGRRMPDRTWRAGLHQAVEAKEGLEIGGAKETLARISFQRFFGLYGRLAGTTGTAWEARHELWQIYGLTTVPLPTHRPCRRDVETDRVHVDEEAKWNAIVQEVRDMHGRGRPILVGTRSVETSEWLSRRLHEHGLEYQVLNAVRHAEEAQVVARAGALGRITVATNMAGRGTDIKLGDGVEALGGLHVIATERHESGRIDRQLFGRAARQGDPGSAVAFTSLDDDVCRRHGSTVLRRVARTRGGAAIRKLVTTAQRRAQRAATAQRRALLRTDDWLDRYLGFAGRET